ncbi:hypothetical protein [Yersinia intermedia]|uniref:hypothetical protein n=1 Tax=Yersinia intermedia TaxID=631 RepID=UPI001F52E6E3|nr:hypothetical protein [Yersinia intermedia]UNK24744.1 hypothetical protein MNQ97_07150 [Yersinia intermedia]
MTTLFHSLMARTGQRLLQQSHYPDDLEWRWSLGYCQGDGCACFGTLDNAALLQLLPALADRQSLNIETRQALATVLSQHPVTVLLTANSCGQRYNHSRGIQIEIIDFPETDAGLHQTLHQVLRHDLDLLCAGAEQQGYQLLDATLPPRDNAVLFERRTWHFALRAIAEANDDFQDLTEDASLWDDTLDLLLHHGARLLTVRVELVCLTTRNSLAQD